MYYMYNKKKTKMLFGINLFGTKDVHPISWKFTLMTACDAISPSPFSDIFEDDFINAVIDDELTRYGETSGKDSNDLYTKSLLYIYVQIRYTQKGAKCITQHI